MLTKEEKENIKQAIDKKARDLDARIEEYKELTKILKIPFIIIISKSTRYNSISILI